MMLQNDSSCDGSLDLPSPYCNGGIALVRVQSGICEFGDSARAGSSDTKRLVLDKMSSGEPESG